MFLFETIAEVIDRFHFLFVTRTISPDLTSSSRAVLYLVICFKALFFGAEIHSVNFLDGSLNLVSDRVHQTNLTYLPDSYFAF